MIQHLLYVPFSGLGLYNGFRGDTWLKNRIKIFKQFVVPSLINQTKQEFIVWVSWRPEEKTNPLVQEFWQSLDGIRGMRFVFTYGGLCFWDDKLSDEDASKKLLDNLTQTLPELESYVDHADFVYMTIQPSDDMYVSNAMEEIQSVLPITKAMGWEKGYIMNLGTKEIAEYNPETLPPFSTIIFPKETFLDPQKHYKFTKPYKSHEYVRWIEPFFTLPGRGFVVGTHGENISTVFDHPYKGKTLTGNERDAVLTSIRAYFTEPLEIKKRPLRLLARQILNKLPGEKRLRSLYHNLPACLKIF